MQYFHSEDGLAVTFKGLKSPANISDTYTYQGSSGSHIGGALQFEGDYKGPLEFVQSMMRINERPPQQDIDASRPIMALIERRLESTCGIANLSSNVKERCQGVECPPLTPP